MSGGHLSSPPLAQSDIQQRLLTLQVAAGSYQESLISLFNNNVYLAARNHRLG